jgi:hypothetical protein
VNEELRSILVDTTGLSMAGVIALFLSVVRRARPWYRTTVRPAARVAVVAVLLQATQLRRLLLITESRSAQAAITLGSPR